MKLSQIEVGFMKKSFDKIEVGLMTAKSFRSLSCRHPNGGAHTSCSQSEAYHRYYIL